jgi:hypothetical protein
MKDHETKQATIGEAVESAGAGTAKEGNGGSTTKENGELRRTEDAPVGGVPAVRAAGVMPIGDRGIHLADLNDLWRFAAMALDSGMAPASFKGQAAVAIAIQMGLELGMTPVTALQNIAVINGKPAPYGAIVKGMIEKSGLLEDYEEFYEGTFPTDEFRAVVISRRKGREKPIRSEFSIGDAKTAKLWGKTGAQGQPTPWVTFPKRMIMWRARQFNYSDNFADVTKGFRTAEVVMDDDAIDSEVVGSSPIAMPSRASENTPTIAAVPTEEAVAS